MPLSHNHKCLFVHIPRTGGTSFRRMLKIDEEVEGLEYLNTNGLMPVQNQRIHLPSHTVPRVLHKEHLCIKYMSQLSLIDQDALKRPGFSDLIQGQVEFSDTILNIPGSDIDLMTSGSRRSDLTDLTTPAKLKEFFDKLKESYDYIVLDTPPIQPVSDTLFIGQATDHNLLIARSKFTKLAGIRSAVKKLKNVNVNVDGIVFNDLDTSKASYYGYYQYGGYYRKYKSYT